MKAFAGCGGPCETDPEEGPTIADVLRTEVVVLSPLSSFHEATYLMGAQREQRAVVYDGRMLVGMLDSSDMDRWRQSRTSRGDDIAVREVMRPIPVRYLIGDPLSTACDEMRRHDIHWLPVLDREGRLAGIVEAT